MQRLVGEAMEDGAFGISSGLIYTPGCYGQYLRQLRKAEGGLSGMNTAQAGDLSENLRQ